MMLGQLVGPAFFSQLRTEQQLGYVVNASFFRYDRVPALQFAVQSGVMDPVGLQERVEAFERGQVEAIGAMDPAAFETVRAGLLSTLRQADVELADRSARWAESLDLGVLTFDHREQVAREVEALDKAGMAAFAAQVLGPEQGRLIVRSFGHTAGAERPKGGCPDTACAAKKLAAPYMRDR
jgi:secreted Zn-dependent insulinase-like peptidase